MKLLLSVALLLAAVIDAHAAVFNNFHNCLNFFYKGIIPSGFQGIAKPSLYDPNNLPDGINVNDLGSPAYICQTFQNTTWFATLYDRGRLMPLYSAYTMNINSGECKRLKTFKYEPQLVYRAVDANMMLRNYAKIQLSDYNKEHKIDERKPINRLGYLLRTSQAEDEDYSNTGYDRGHLNPCGHQSANEYGYKATFTLTNIVPMAPMLNEGAWSQYEQQMLNIAAQCAHVYVITGIVPGNVPIPESRLTAPNYVWNAYCCVDNNDKVIKSGAALAENMDQSKVEPYQVLGEFQTKLQNLLGLDHNIELFESGCKPSNG